MHIHDRNVLTPLFFQLALIAALAAGIGCDGKSTPKDAGQADAGKDAPISDGPQGPEASPPDLAPADHPQANDLGSGTDTSKADAPLVTLDAPPLDGPMGERPPLMDVPPAIDARIDPRIDAESVDSGQNDSGPVDVSDALSVADALSTTQARMTFVFKNNGTQVVYLQMECAVQFQVVSQVTSTVYPNKSICLCRCADPTCLDLPNCPPCEARSGIAVEPGKTFETTWTAQTSTTGEKTGTRGTFKCIDYAPIPTGAYQVSIPVFPSAADAAANTNASTATVPFQLTIADAKVEVPLR
jgi:hypothetical protein